MDKMIMVQFKGYVEAEPFTMAVFDLLRSDDATEWIVDGNTGEVLYSAE